MNITLRFSVSLFFAWLFVFQNVAFAMKPIEVSQNSQEAQLEKRKLEQKISQKFAKMSDKRKVRYLKRTKRRLKRAQRRLERKRTTTFDSVLTKEDTTVDLTSEEKELYSNLTNKGNSSQKIKITADTYQMQTVTSDTIEKLDSAIMDIKSGVFNTTNTNTRSDLLQEILYEVIGGLIAIALVVLGIIFPAFGVVLFVIGTVFQILAVVVAVAAIAGLVWYIYEVNH